MNLFTFRGAGADAGTWAVRLWRLVHVARRPRPQDFDWTFLEGFLGFQRLGRYRMLPREGAPR